MPYGFSETKKWHGGYFFQGTGSIYNPNAVIQAVESGKFGTYWTETETYESLKRYIDMDLDGLKQAIVAMLRGEHYPIDIRTAMANRIFEMRMLNMFITEEALESDAIRRGEQDKNQFARNGRLNMERE